VGDPRGLHFTTQALANVAWAHGALGVRDAPLMAAVVGALAERPMVFEARAQELASVLWALATLGLTPRDLARAAEADSSADGSAPELAGRLGPGVPFELASAALRRPGECGAGELANILWSLASLRQLEQQQQEEEEQQQQQQRRDLVGGSGSSDAAQATSLLPAAVAAAVAAESPASGSAAEGAAVFAALTRALLQRLQSANSADVTQALWALATARVFDAQVLSALSAAAAALAATGLLSPAELANSAWALARLGYRDGGALGVLGDAAAEAAAEGVLCDVDVSNLAWAYGALEVRRGGMLFAKGKGSCLVVLWGCGAAALHSSPCCGRPPEMRSTHTRAHTRRCPTRRCWRPSAATRAAAPRRWTTTAS
jgi:hypothetical protein